MSDRSPVFCTKALNAILNTKVVDKTTVSALLKAMQYAPDAPNRYLALDALKGFGKDAILGAAPMLLSIIKDCSREAPHQRTGDASWRLEILQLLPLEEPVSRQLLIDCLGEPDAAVYEPAAIILAKMGDKAKFAIPALLRLATSFPELRTEKTRNYNWPAASAARALLAIGPDSRQPLIKLLGDREIGRDVARGLYWDRKRAVPLLIDALQDGTPLQRYNAALALDLIAYGHGESAVVAEAALKKALQDKDEKVRQTAAQALKRLSPEYRGADDRVPPLLEK
jgi:HEAT repeat protein